MTTLNDLTLEAVRNRKTGKLFIIVDDTLDARYKVVNTAGEVIILPDLLFEEDPQTVARDQFASSFTPEQLEAYERHQSRAAERAAAEAARPQRAIETRRIDTPEPKKKVGPKKVKKTSSRTGLGAAWSTPRLTFYRHKIDPLDVRQFFRVSVDGGDTYEITKEDFLTHFNDVVMSPTYRTEGHYTYPDIPSKMTKYRRTTAK